MGMARAVLIEPKQTINPVCQTNIIHVAKMSETIETGYLPWDVCSWIFAMNQT
jgi:hypothetical protein